MAWVYILSEVCQGNRLYTVGHYSPDGDWHPDNDYDNKEDAAERCRYLSGGNNRPDRRGMGPL